jgi:hypothetical protein
MDTLYIYRLSDEEPIRLAAAELRKYLRRATGAMVHIRARAHYEENSPGLWVGLFTAFSGRIVQRSSGHPFDDEIAIEVSGRNGIVAGVYPRSVLIAAYRYLTELGCRWARPGKDGEYIPSVAMPLERTISIHETASYRHRCVCIEGAVSWEHVRDIIDWLPKVGLNAYFVQFREAYQFFVRWYQHELNPRLRPVPFTVEDARDLTRRIRTEVRKRGMILHMVGHGWTCEPFGIPGLGWMPYEEALPEETRRYIAEVNGKRDLWGGIPLNTNLCYGNPEARAIMVRAIGEYAETHPEVQILHLWLADGSNNHCECPICRDHRPSDLYVKLCNEVDAELTRRGQQTKVVFLIYVDLLWPPETERLVNPDRFILMFAPITRTYTTSFASGVTGRGTIPPFTRNRLTFPRTPEDNVAFLRGWQRVFPGDSFDFDYHLMWDHFRDPGYYRIAEVLCEDIRGLHDIRLNGLTSCQVQRCFLPTGLPMMVMARTLWKRDLPFEEVVDDLYRATFGVDWEKVKRYTRRLSDLFHPTFLRGEEDDAGCREAMRKLKQIPAEIERFLPVIEANVNVPEVCHARSWRYLREHADICLAMAPAVAALADGDREGARRAARRLVECVRRKERRIHRVFDVVVFIRTIGRALGLREEELQ